MASTRAKHPAGTVPEYAFLPRGSPATSIQDGTRFRGRFRVKRPPAQVPRLAARSPCQTFRYCGIQEPSSVRLKSWNRFGASSFIVRAILSKTRRSSSSAPGAVRISIT